MDAGAVQAAETDTAAAATDAGPITNADVDADTVATAATDAGPITSADVDAAAALLAAEWPRS